MADGWAELGDLLADELTSIGELAFADKKFGDIATGVMPNMIGVPAAIVL